MDSQKVKGFVVKYLVFLVLLLLVFYLLPNNNTKIIAIGFLPLLVWLPSDIKNFRAWRERKRKEASSSQH